MRFDALAFLEGLFKEPPNPPPLSPTDLPADWHVLWDERAAVMEYDGGLPREQAEHLALLEIVQQMNASRR